MNVTIVFDEETYVLREPTFEDAINLERMGLDLLTGSGTSSVSQVEQVMLVINLLLEEGPPVTKKTPLRFMKAITPIIKGFFGDEEKSPSGEEQAPTETLESLGLSVRGSKV